ncbi:MAG: DNA/RNA non-specific endonuclease [Porphyromonas sp.]|nr:DNA/RNA non-specific endonuclease [Porphyromonas sp.]
MHGISTKGRYETGRVGIMFLLLWVALGMASCRQKPGKDIPNPGKDGLVFSASYENGWMKAADGEWEAGDRIGVFTRMSKPEPAWTAGEVIVNNNLFSTEEGGSRVVFRPATSSDEIHLMEGQKIDILAYYPHRPALEGQSVPLSVADQSTPNKINLLYADNLSEITNKSSSADLVFRHALAKIRFNVSSTDGSSVEGLTVSIEGFPTEGRFDLLTRTWSVDEASVKTLSAKINGAGSIATAGVFILPVKKDKAMQALFRLPSGKEYVWKFRIDNNPFRMGHEYSYNIRLNPKGGIDPDDKVGYRELPEKTSLPNTLMYTHFSPELQGARNYTFLLDTKLKFAYWVAYPLHGFYLGSYKRLNNFIYDPAIPHEYQAYLEKKGYQSKDGISYDRGHQLPSGDRTAGRKLNDATFYSTNMTPQASTLNQQIWQRLEAKVRSWQAALVSNGAGKDTLYVVTGAGMEEGKPVHMAQDNNGVDCPAPHYYYKVLAKMDRHGDFHTIGFILENTASIAGGDYMKYKCTVKEVEEKTGFKFFPFLKDEVKGKIEEHLW